MGGGSDIPEFCNEVRVVRGDDVILLPLRCGDELLECLVWTAAMVGNSDDVVTLVALLLIVFSIFYLAPSRNFPSSSTPFLRARNALCFAVLLQSH